MDQVHVVPFTFLLMSWRMSAWEMNTDTVKPRYNGIRYNDKIRYNDNLNGTIPYHKMG